MSEILDPAAVPTPVSAFQQLGLSEPLLRALEKSGYTLPTPIQAQAIPLLLEGRDLLGQAQTGTGKTAAFALPMLQGIDVELKQPQVLVLTPTRELAIQVAEAFERYAAQLPGLRVVPIYGGQDYLVQFRQLDRGVQVVVGTPGRVIDHVKRGSLKLDGLRGLVLDEADEMLRMGFVDDVEWVLSQLPTERQIALFSATLPEPIRRIAQQHLRNPVEITIKQKTATADTVRQRFVIAAPHQKELALARILEAESIDGVLVFVKMRSTTEPLADFLVNQGYRAAALNGDVPQKQREWIVDKLRTGSLDIVVATDVAARGLDVQRISHVINYDLPFDSEAYVHRIGRTGRAGRSGEAILFVHPRDRRMLKSLEQQTRQPIERMEFPSNRTINKRRIAKFHERITGCLAHPQIDSFASIVEQYRRENDVPLEKVAAALALLANREEPLLLTEEIKPSEFFDGHGSGRSSDQRPGRRSIPQRPAEDMETFRIEVGRAHQVQPGNIVGAIANETGLDSALIGRISIFDDHSTIDMPTGMPRELFHSLKKIWVAGRQLKISRIETARPNLTPPPAPPAKAKKSKGKRKQELATS